MGAIKILVSTRGRVINYLTRAVNLLRKLYTQTSDAGLWWGLSELLDRMNVCEISALVATGHHTNLLAGHHPLSQHLWLCWRNGSIIEQAHFSSSGAFGGRRRFISECIPASQPSTKCTPVSFQTSFWKLTYVQAMSTLAKAGWGRKRRGEDRSTAEKIINANVRSGDETLGAYQQWGAKDTVHICRQIRGTACHLLPTLHSKKLVPTENIAPRSLPFLILRGCD